MRKSAKRKKKSKPLLFVQGHGTYPNETLVAVGATGDEILAYAKRTKARKEFVDWIGTWKDDNPSDSGYVRSETSGGWTVLWLKPYEETWAYWEILIHELTHLVDFALTEQKRMGAETEARAYQTEYLFREIRRKIQGK